MFAIKTRDRLLILRDKLDPKRDNKRCEVGLISWV